MMELSKIDAYLQGTLSKKRYRHSLGVAEEAVRLARHYGADSDKAFLAGLVHDCAKEVEPQEAVRLLKERYGVTPDAMSLQLPRLLHGPLGACMAQSEFEIYDPEVLDAIRYHSTGKAGMSLLSKVIFIADFVEPGRDYTGVDDLRKLAFSNLEEAMLVGIDYTICDLIKEKQTIHPDTVHCRNDLLVQGTAGQQPGKERQ